MNSLAALLVAFAVAAPPGLQDESGVYQADQVVRAAPERERSATGLQQPAGSLVRTLDEARRVPIQRQVRIQQRVILKIAPPSRQVRERIDGEAAASDEEREYKVGDKQRCILMNDVIAVQPHRGNRLLLYMRHRQLMSAKLERACGAEDFYSGFYVERNRDGRLCVRRDRLQSRAGAQCELSEMNHAELKED